MLRVYALYKRSKKSELAVWEDVGIYAERVAQYSPSCFFFTSVRRYALPGLDDRIFIDDACSRNHCTPTFFSFIQDEFKKGLPQANSAILGLALTKIVSVAPLRGIFPPGFPLSGCFPIFVPSYFYSYW